MNAIFYILIILSFISLLVMMIRKMPALSRLSEEELSSIEKRKNLAKKDKEINKGQYRISLMVNLEKFLRRAKVLSLKMENLLNQWIQGLREKSQKIAQKSKRLIEQKIEHKKTKIIIQPKTPPEETTSDFTRNFTEDTNNIAENQEKKTDDDSIEIKEASATESFSNQISLADLSKPIKEEQQWIDLIVKNPKNITAYKSLGLLYWKQHSYADAKSSLETALKLGSKDKKVVEILEELKKIKT